MSNNKHLTRDERIIIQTGISNGSKKTSIADTLQKEKSTVGKEIKQHRFLKAKSTLLKECTNYKKCKYNRSCHEDCLEFIQFKCSRRDRSPGACNGCSNYSRCRFNKYWYSADLADKSYHETLVDSRVGANLTTQEALILRNLIKEGLDKGHSPYLIKMNHSEITQCEKTIYNYIDNDTFSIVGIKNIDLRNKVKRKLAKKEAKKYKKRQDRSYLVGRTYKDFIAYIENSEKEVKVVEMDTVYNQQSGPYIQTFFIREADILLAVYHEHKDAASMVKGFYSFVDFIGIDNFHNVCDCILTDRGPEFSTPDLIEIDEKGQHYCKVFYCDPMASYQKACIEKEHVYLRYILPKGYRLKALGLDSQSALNKVISHINSFPREKRNGKTPFQLLGFYFEDVVHQLQKKTSLKFQVKMSF